MAFSARTAKRMVLSSYAQGDVSRSTAMKLLGLDWYGDLLGALSDAGLQRPTLPASERSIMTEYASRVLKRS